MEPITEKRQALDCAIEIISRGDDDELRYVALELRRCIEAVVYEKLWVYRDRFPAEVARKWQPPQAFRALLIMEPDAECTKTVSIVQQVESGAPSLGPPHILGTDHRFSFTWLNKTYNKLGSYLHASWPFAKNHAKNEIESTREFLKRVIADMEPFVRQSFTSTLAKVVAFKCSECDTVIKANAAGVERASEITCLNPDCGCRYFATNNGKDFIFTLDEWTAGCPKCMQEIHVPTQKLAFGYRFTCSGCKQRYTIVEQWQLDELDNESGQSINEG